MMNLKLTERMQVIADFVASEEVVADIGTDHGYIPLWLIINKKCRGAILADINQGPLDKAAANAALYLEQDIFPDMRLGSGMQVLAPGEADTVIIAGMGGLMIRDILSQDIAKTRLLKKIILQPRNNSRELREWIIRVLVDFVIKDERVVKEGSKYSEIICAVRREYITPKDAERISDANEFCAMLGLSRSMSLEIPFMYMAYKDPAVADYLDRRRAVENDILSSIKQNGRTEASLQRIEVTKRRLEYITKMSDAYHKKYSI